MAYGCSTDILNVGEPMLVVDGFIEDGGFPLVMVTTTLPVSEEYRSLDDVRDCIARSAKVTVSDGENEVILTGMVNRDYFPPYVYTTGNLRGRAGKNYSLKVEYHGMTATAVTTIPESVPLDRLIPAKSDVADTLYSLEAFFRDRPQSGDHYRLFVFRKGIDSTYRNAFLGVMDDSVLGAGEQENGVLPSGRETSMRVYPPEPLKWATYTPYFVSGTTVHVKLCTMDDAVFAYWSDFADVSSFSRNAIFTSNHNIRSNIHDGLGIWAGYGVSTMAVQIP